MAYAYLTSPPSSNCYHLTQFTMLMEMVTGLQAKVMKMQQIKVDRQVPRSWEDPVRPLTLTF